MKKMLFIMLIAFLFVSAENPVFAAAGASSAAGDVEIDGSFSLATGPGAFDSGYGLNFGAGYMMNSVVKDLQGRIDIGFYKFNGDFGFPFATSLNYTRIPVTVSARYYFPIVDQLKVFAQAGVEASQDSKEYLDIFGFSHSKDELNIGVSPGGGIEFNVNPLLSIFALARFHAITDSYISMHFGAAFHF